MLRSDSKMRWLRWPLAVLVASSLAACGGAQSRYASHMRRGNQYLTQGNLDRARVEFRNALQIEPKSADALYFNGQVMERLGNVRGAFGLYQAAIEAQPDLVPAISSLASIYVVGGVPDKAMALVKPALAKHPDSADLLVERAAARFALKDPSGARADAERTLRLDPGSARAVGLLAAIERDSGDFPAAISLVTAAVRRAPRSTELREVLASLYFDAKRPDEGEQQLRQLIELQPRDLQYRYELARQLTRGHQIDAAQRALEDAVKADPHSDEPKLSLVGFISAQRSAADGEQALRDFIARAPDDYDLRMGLGEMLEQQGTTANAVRVYQEIVELDGDHPHGLAARDRMAQIDAAQGHYDAALQLVADVLRRDPRDIDALALRGDIRAERNDLAGAIADLRAVLQDQPDAVSVRRTLARAYIANGQPALAEEALRTAMDSAPTDVAVRIELAEVLAVTHQVDDAVTLLEGTVKLAPTDPRVHEALTRAYLAKGDLAAAQKAAEDLESLRPKAAIGYYLAGRVAQAEKRPEDAEKAFEQALALQPGALDALDELTRLELSRNEGARAMAQAQSAVDHDPKNPMLLNLLGELYLETRDFPQAELAFSHVTELAPHWAVPYRDLALAKVASHDTAGAVAAYEAGLKSAPGAPQLATELAALYEREGRTDDAIAQLDALYNAHPRQAMIASSLAMLLVTYRTDRRSLDRARDLTAPFASSDNASLLDSNGWVRFKRGEYAEAVETLARAAQRAPGSNEIRYHLAMAELRVGERDRARTDLEGALSGGGAARFVGADNARAVLASLKSGGAG